MEEGPQESGCAGEGRTGKGHSFVCRWGSRAAENDHTFASPGMALQDYWQMNSNVMPSPVHLPPGEYSVRNLRETSTDAMHSHLMDGAKRSERRDEREENRVNERERKRDGFICIL